jgi:hypothetical protein
MIVFPFSFIRTTANNLLLEYNTFNTSSYSGSGTTIYDISGNSRNGTITGSPTWTSNYFTFSDDYVTTPNLSSAIPASNEVHSVEVWVYPTDNGVLVQYNGQPTPDAGYHFSAIEIVGGNLEVGLWNGTVIVSTGNIGAVSFNQWHQIVLTYNGSVCKGYLDGVFKGSVNVAWFSPMDESLPLPFYMNFGYQDSTSQGDGGDFNGRFGIWQVYNTALTDAQVLSNYNSTLPTFDLVIKLDANDISSYPGSGTTVFNLQSGSYNHTLTGATYTVLDGIKCFDCTTGTKRVVVDGTGPTLPTSGYTYITWARILPSSASWRSLLRTNNSVPILVQLETDDLGYYDSVFRDSGYDVTPIEDVWVQYAVVGDDTSSIFYINGTQVGTVAYGAGGDTHLQWGNNGTAVQPFGYIANLYFYNRKLSFSEIIEQYNTLSPTFPNHVTSNLVLYFDPSNPSSYPGSGTTITDLSGNGLNGTMSNISFTSPYFSYNGTSSQVLVADNALLQPGSGDWTMEVWVNQSVSGNYVVLGKFPTGGAASYAIRTVSTQYYAQLGSSSGVLNSTFQVGTIGTWYQLVYVFTNVADNTLQTFVNGSSIGSVGHSSESIVNTTNPLYIGSYNGGAFAQWFNGRIGITRLYNAALTSSEILQNYNADKSKYGL